MDLFDAIAKRYSYRGPFTDAPVPREDLRKIVEAGIHAPSAVNGQVAQFVIVDDADLLAQIAAIIDRPVCNTAQAMIVCATDNRAVYKDVAFPVEDCAAAVENMLLRVSDVAARVGRLLSVPEAFTVRIVLPLGVAAEPGEQKEKLPFEKRAWFNRYGQ